MTNPRGTEPKGSGSGAGGKNYNVLVLLMLTSVVAHGILFSSNQVQSLQGREIATQVAKNPVPPQNMRRPSDSEEEDEEEEELPQEEVKSLEEPQVDQVDADAREPSPLLRASSTPPEEEQVLPHWRLSTDCSSYSFDCFAAAQRDHKYLSYPFSESLRNDIERAAGAPEHNSDDPDTTAQQQQLREEWSVELLEELPSNWIDYLNNNTTRPPVEERNYVYPPEVSTPEYEACMNLAINQNKSTIEQLDVLFSGESPRIVPEPDTNMVAFTISDYGYVQDMLHEVFQMMDHVVGFSPKHFFLVAIDPRSVKMACQYGYPVVMWKADEGNLRDAVANTKVILSHDLVKRGMDFFFTEMDVWWIRSPKPNLVKFQQRHEDDSESGDQRHIYFSGHQNNYNAPNIGVYAVKANKFSEEYFRVSLQILQEKPETHDQHVLAEVHRLFQHTYDKQNYKFGGNFLPDGPPEAPAIENPFKALYFSPHEVVGDERPTTTQLTLAIHTLNGMPLQAPHGKKMVAKELGVYYGFHSNPQAAGTISDANSDDDAAAGYYDRGGKHRRYLWLDSELRSNFYSIAHQERYHDKMTLEWTMAILIALARKTNRILVLPQVFDADMDAGTYFPWTMMDYSKVAEMVDFRETNFLTNPKAWTNRENHNWPFESIVSTGLFRVVEEHWKASIYTQAFSQSSVVAQKAYTRLEHKHQWLDAWVGSLSALPEVDSAEVLMVNPDAFMNGGEAWELGNRLFDWKKRVEEAGGEANLDPSKAPPMGHMERDVLEIYQLLGWCWDIAFRHTANKVSASDSCYGIGSPSTRFNFK